jgi:hypothetical protein
VKLPRCQIYKGMILLDSPADSSPRGPVERIELTPFNPSAQSTKGRLFYENGRVELVEFLFQPPTVVSPEDRSKTQLLQRAQSLIQWMSGSADFAPGGQAYEHWMKSGPKLLSELQEHRPPEPASVYGEDHED